MSRRRAKKRPARRMSASFYITWSKVGRPRRADGTERAVAAEAFFGVTKVTSDQHNPQYDVGHDPILAKFARGGRGSRSDHARHSGGPYDHVLVDCIGRAALAAFGDIGPDASSCRVWQGTFLNAGLNAKR